MDWIQRFYAKQAEWSGLYRGPPQAYHQGKIGLLTAHAPAGARILELGAGGGQHAALAVDAGFDVTAVELVPESAENIRQLAVERPRLTAIQGDFYTVPLDGRFDVVCYWDGFGVGTDDDQRRLLRRIADEWLTDDGVALIDIYTPWSAAKSAGYRQKISELAHRTYDYDASGGRWLDIWTDGQQTVRQSLRCYSPPDLALLLEGTGLSLMSVTPGGGMDWAARTWHDAVPLVQAMMFTVRLSRINSRP